MPPILESVDRVVTNRPCDVFVITTADVATPDGADYTPPASIPSEGGDLKVFVTDAVNALEILGG